MDCLVTKMWTMFLKASSYIPFNKAAMFGQITFQLPDIWGSARETFQKHLAVQKLLEIAHHFSPNLSFSLYVFIIFY